MRAFLTATAVALLAGCQSNPAERVIIDPKGVDQAVYQQDLAECNTIAQQAKPGRSAMRGAIGGAVIGGALGGAMGDSRTAGRMAGGGAVIGGASQAGEGMSERDRVLRNCMTGRGYRVLN
ncbi:MAG: hypothetical protein K0R03_870 [Moraxellaceae bacterium]|jgi:hypothetical protein|nr:hypothetical protein [Moraxellaceae bacterium]